VGFERMEHALVEQSQKHPSERNWTNLGSDTTFPLAELLTRLILNPHAGWQATDRLSALEFLLRVAEQLERVFNETFFSLNQPVLARLLADQDAALAFWQYVKRKQPTCLTVVSAPITLEHAPKLSALKKLRIGLFRDRSLTLLPRVAPKLKSFLVAGYLDGLVDLDGIEKLTELEEFFVYGLRIESLEPLQFCKQLRELEVYGCPIKSLQPLAKLPLLGSLSLQSTTATDLKPLSALKSLHKLTLFRVPSETFSSLADLDALNELVVPADSVLPQAVLRRQERGELTIHRVDFGR
jgi:Leucine-rich repeat (LRR) protein